MTAEPGPLGEEAARLVEALGEWARGAAPWIQAHTGELPLGTDSAECRLCPVCQLLSVVRQTRPETFAHLTDATSSFVAALRTVIDPVGSGHRHGTSGVQRINLDEDSGAAR
jgi:hypothetical protein